MKKLITLTFVLLMSIAIKGFGQNKEQKSGLSGKRFTVELTLSEGRKTGWRWTKDELSFKSAKLKSKTMFTREHFSPADFIFTNDSEGKLHVTAKSKNPGGSEIQWDLTISGDQLQGTATWTNRQGEQTYLVKGSCLK